MPYHYTTGATPTRLGSSMPVTFEFYRYRFHFRARETIQFPAGKSANIVRGAFGAALKHTAPPAVYTRLFEPGAALRRSPSGFSDWPRPFVFRSSHLDGRTIAPGGTFFLDAHVFDMHEPSLEYFRAALAHFAEQGTGPGRGRAALEQTEQLDLEDHASEVWNEPRPPAVVWLEAEGGGGPLQITVRFHTPTELKDEGELVERPDFPILFRRIRDRISTLRALYGAGPLDVDFRGMGERAARVRMTRCELVWERAMRRSGRTGQVHSIGGFTGEAEYQGDLGEFIPWLRAARWVGVGRQTVWGKGDVRVLEPDRAALSG